MQTYNHLDKNLNQYLELLKSSYEMFFLERLDNDLYESSSVIASHSNIKNLIGDWSNLSNQEMLEKPLFVYANLQAQKLWEISWLEFINFESHLSAQEPQRESRAELLRQVSENGFIDNYSGLRVSKTGKIFLIKSARVWQVLDKNNKSLGQAVKFSNWEPINQ